MIMESHAGAWSPTALKVIGRVAELQAAVWNEDGEASSLKIAQRLSVALQRENARAVLKRRIVETDLPVGNGWVECDDTLE